MSLWPDERSKSEFQDACSESDSVLIHLPFFQPLVERMPKKSPSVVEDSEDERNNAAAAASEGGEEEEEYEIEKITHHQRGKFNPVRGLRHDDESTLHGLMTGLCRVFSRTWSSGRGTTTARTAGWTKATPSKSYATISSFWTDERVQRRDGHDKRVLGVPS